MHDRTKIFKREPVFGKYFFVAIAQASVKTSSKLATAKKKL